MEYAPGVSRLRALWQSWSWPKRIMAVAAVLISVYSVAIFVWIFIAFSRNPIAH